MLYLCATPIGNLGDITLRAVETLERCDMIYCEDTRHSLQLLNHLGIKKPLFSCHEHNEKQRAQEVAALLTAGKEIVYISDAGMPGISDPGCTLVAECIRQDLPYTVLPGASAVVTAAVLSGFPASPFTFFGFLPRDNKEKKQMLSQIADCTHLALLYESPHRVQSTLKLLYETLGDRPAAVLRELTKKFESVNRGDLSALIAQYEEAPKGECVIAVLCQKEKPQATPDELEAFLQAALSSGSSVKDAASAAAQALGVVKKSAYQKALELTQNQ